MKLSAHQKVRHMMKHNHIDLKSYTILNFCRQFYNSFFNLLKMKLGRLTYITFNPTSQLVRLVEIPLKAANKIELVTEHVPPVFLMEPPGTGCNG